jgi:hypothetical protein
MLFLSIVLADKPHLPPIPHQSPAQTGSIHMAWCSCTENLSTVGASTPVLLSGSVSVPAPVTVPVVDGAVISAVVGVLLATIVMSSASTPCSSASAISSLLRPLSALCGAHALRLSSVQFVAGVGAIVCIICPAGSHRLLSHTFLVVSTCVAHELLNATRFS